MSRVSLSSLLSWGLLFLIGAVGFALFSLLSTHAAQLQVRSILQLIVGSEYSEARDTVFYPSIGTWGKLSGTWINNQPDGVFNYRYNEEPMTDVVQRSLLLPFKDTEGVLGWWVPVPVLVPLVLHVLLVWIIPQLAGLIRRRSVEFKTDTPLVRRAVVSTCYALVIILLFQFGRLFWSSDAWDRKFWSTLYIVRLGSVTYFVYCAAFFAIYIYSIFATAKIEWRSRAGTARRNCPQCGYIWNSDGSCQECGYFPGEFEPSKTRMNYAALTFSLVAAFFIPMFVAVGYATLVYFH